MKVYIVLGMHRSGTSMLSRALQKIGINMGKSLIQEDSENIDFVRLNDKILNEAQGSWDQPPPEDKIIKLFPKFMYDIQNLIVEHKEEYWGFKDPRTVLTLPLYLKLLTHEVYLICIFRDPKLVALSLQKRDKMPIDKGLSLCKEYNKRLLKYIANFLNLKIEISE